MLSRQLATDIQHAATQYPVVTVLGPRQSGKSTLVQHTFPNRRYLSLEDPDIRQLALNDPRAFLADLPEGGIIDEIHRAPDLLSYIQGIVDKKQQNGLFILTGSQQLDLNAAISQSLAGRTDIVRLLPLSIEELAQEQPVEELLLKGFYPRLQTQQLEPTRFYRNYFETYVERDLRQLINVKNLSKFELFIRLCAGRIGQLFNASSIANEVGVSSHTISEWMSVLEASFILFKLPPYFANINKRLTKSPKYYFYDVGLACYLLGIETQQQLKRDPLYGNLFENLVILEAVKARYNQGKNANFYFYRDSTGVEIDLIFEHARKFTAIEIKSAQTFHQEFLKNINKVKEDFKGQIQNSYLVFNGELTSKFKDTQLINALDTANIIKENS
jgi:predicted AAA+ superfamily ATPase